MYSSEWGIAGPTDNLVGISLTTLDLDKISNVATYSFRHSLLQISDIKFQAKYEPEIWETAEYHTFIPWLNFFKPNCLFPNDSHAWFVLERNEEVEIV